MKKWFITSFAIAILLLGIIGFLVYNGYIWFNIPSIEKYPLRGIDVSNHQGTIDWKKVKEDNIEFAFIKATEGKDYTDKFFIENWKGAYESGITRGAYHFFTFRSSGMDQANNFIKVVPVEKDSLPPVIDLEFDGNSKDVPDKNSLKKELGDFISKVENHYKQKPIFYLTHESYETYILGDFGEYKIWIRDIIQYPYLKDKREWVFWQFSNRGRLNGINGFVDFNVFDGNAEGLKELLNKE